MKTLEQIFIFNETAKKAANKHSKTSKVMIAIGEVAKQTDVIIQEFQKNRESFFRKELWEKQLELALVDKDTGAVLFAPAGSAREFLFDKQGLKKVIEIEEAVNNAWATKVEELIAVEHEISPVFIGTGIHLSDLEFNAFKGFIIPEDANRDDYIVFENKEPEVEAK